MRRRGRRAQCDTRPCMIPPRRRAPAASPAHSPVPSGARSRPPPSATSSPPAPPPRNSDRLAPPAGDRVHRSLTDETNTNDPCKQNRRERIRPNAAKESARNHTE
eukprot:277703-Prymnesium_polylepis.1